MDVSFADVTLNWFLFSAMMTFFMFFFVKFPAEETIPVVMAYHPVFAVLMRVPNKLLRCS